MADKPEWVEIGLTCADVCGALERGTSGKGPEDLSEIMHWTIKRLMAWVKPAMHGLDSSLTHTFYRRVVMKIQKKASELQDQSVISWFFRAESVDDPSMVAGWKSELANLLNLFNVRSDTHV